MQSYSYSELNKTAQAAVLLANKGNISIDGQLEIVCKYRRYDIKGNHLNEPLSYYSKDHIMKLFRCGACDDLSVDDCREIFLTILKGGCDISVELLDELGDEYEVDIEALYMK